MSRYILVGETGASDVLVIDTQTDTINRLEKTSLHADVQAMLANGTIVTKGISIAAAIDSSEDAVGRFFFENN